MLSTNVAGVTCPGNAGTIGHFNLATTTLWDWCARAATYTSTPLGQGGSSTQRLPLVQQRNLCTTVFYTTDLDTSYAHALKLILRKPCSGVIHDACHCMCLPCATVLPLYLRPRRRGTKGRVGFANSRFCQYVCAAAVCVIERFYE